MNEDKIKKIKKTLIKIFIAVTAPVILMVSLFLLWDYHTFRTEIYTNFNSEQLDMISEDFKFRTDTVENFEICWYYGNYYALINLNTNNLDIISNLVETVLMFDDSEMNTDDEYQFSGNLRFHRDRGYKPSLIAGSVSPSRMVYLFYYDEKESYYLAIVRSYLDGESKEFYIREENRE